MAAFAFRAVSAARIDAVGTCGWVQFGRRTGTVRADGPRGERKASAKGRTGKVARKYRNPDDPDTTGSERGRKPKRVDAHPARHGNLDAVTIKRRASLRDPRDDETAEAGHAGTDATSGSSASIDHS